MGSLGERMWCKFHTCLPMSKSKHYWDQCMPTSLQCTASTMIPRFIAVHVILAPHSWLVRGFADELKNQTGTKVIKAYRKLAPHSLNSLRCQSSCIYYKGRIMYFPKIHFFFQPLSFHGPKIFHCHMFRSIQSQ